MSGTGIIAKFSMSLMLNNISDIPRSYVFTLNTLEQTILSKYQARLSD